MFSFTMGQPTNIASSEERRAEGRAQRRNLRRQQHAHWQSSLRRHDPLDLLRQSMKGRVASLVPLKYELMMASPFGYFRGAVPVMAADLSLLPHTEILNQICGDAHVRNLGAYAAPDGRLLFDINDFDESVRAPFEWDLKRMGVSLVLAGREAGEKEAALQQVVARFVEQYRSFTRRFAAMPVLEVARFQVHRLRKVAPLEEVLLKAERATPQHTLETLTIAGRGHRRFRPEPPVLRRVGGSEARAVLGALAEYRASLLPERRHLLAQYRALDVAFKVVGTGSVGTRDYCIYLEGNGPCDPLFLQVKEEPGSAYLPYLGVKAGHAGRAVAEGQRAMQMQSDPLLGWTTLDGRAFLVRQLNDHKASIDVEALAGPGLEAYAELCGELLARGHARSGDVQKIMGYVGSGRSFVRALTDFAVAYADQSEQDWEQLRRARRTKARPAKATGKPAAKKVAAKK